MTENTAAIAKKAYVLLLNEFMPRAKKLGMSVDEFLPPEVAAFIIQSEVNGTYTRNDVRKFLDEIVRLKGTE
jgi:hypothetical protein